MISFTNTSQDALRVLKPDSDMSDGLDPAKKEDAAIVSKLNDALGTLFASQVAADIGWAKEVLGVTAAS